MDRTVTVSAGVEVFGDLSVYAHFMVDGKEVEGVFLYYPENQFELGRDIRNFVINGKLPYVGGDGRREMSHGRAKVEAATS